MHFLLRIRKGTVGAVLDFRAASSQDRPEDLGVEFCIVHEKFPHTGDTESLRPQKKIKNKKNGPPPNVCKKGHFLVLLQTGTLGLQKN